MERKKRFGDRSDGRRLRTVPAYESVSPYIMVNRNDASNFFNDTFDIAAAEQYVKQKQAAGLKGFGILHILIAAYVRAISQKPGINRFISGQRAYARNNIIVCMSVKKSLDINEVSTLIKVILDPRDTAEDVYNKFSATYEDAFANTSNDFDGTAKLISAIPGLVKKFFVHILKTLDYFGWLPKSLLKVSPFHGSMFITSMGSLGIPPIYHHLYNFGNVPVFIAFGAKRYENRIEDDGTVKRHKYVDFTVVTDERICDGFYFAQGFKLFKRYLNNPYMLDTPPETVVEDID